MTSTTREVACLAWDLVPVVRHEERRGNRLLDHDPSTALSIALAGASGPLQLSHRLDAESLRAHFLRPACLSLSESSDGDVLRCEVSGLELRGGTSEAPEPGPRWTGRRLVLSTRVEQLRASERTVVCTPADFEEIVASERERGNAGGLVRRDPHYPESFELHAPPDVEAVEEEFDLPGCVTAVHPERRRWSLGCSRAYVGVAGSGRAALDATSWRREVQQHAPPRRVFAARHGDFHGDLTTSEWQHLSVRAAGTELLVRRASDDPFEVQNLHASGGWVDAAYRLTVDLPRRGPVDETLLTQQEAGRVAQRWRDDGRLSVVPEDL